MDDYSQYESNEEVDLEATIVEQESKEVIQKTAYKIGEPKHKETVHSGVFIGIDYAKKEPIIGISIDITPTPTSNSKEPSFLNAFFPATHDKKSSAGDKVLDFIGFPTGTIDTFKGLGGQANAIGKEMTSGWDMKDANGQAMLDELGLTFSRFVQSPRLLGPYLETLARNIQNDYDKINIVNPDQNIYKFSYENYVRRSSYNSLLDYFLKGRILSYNEWHDAITPPQKISLNTNEKEINHVGPYDEDPTKYAFNYVSHEDGDMAEDQMLQDFMAKDKKEALKNVKKLGWDKISSSIDSFIEAVGKDNIAAPYIFKEKDNEETDNSEEENPKPDKLKIIYANTYNDTKNAEEQIKIVEDPAFSNKEYSKPVPQVAGNTLRKQIHDLRNKSIEYMLHSGPDFMGHMYDIMLVCMSEQSEFGAFKDLFEALGESEFYKEHIDIENLIDSSMFMVRAGGIEIPQIENDVFDLKFLFDSVKKQRPKIKYERKAELKILLDEPLLFMTTLNLLSNNNMVLFDGWESRGYQKIDENNGKRFPEIFAPYSTNRLIKENVINKKLRIDLIVKHQKLLGSEKFDDLRHATNQYTEDAVIKNFAGLDSFELPLWWFEDINFLGQGSDLQFDRDGDSTTEMTYPFLFKRCTRINREGRAGSSNGIKTQISISGENAVEASLFKENKLKEMFYGQSDQEWFKDYLESRGY